MTIFYVCVVSGKDENTGSQQMPFKTINAATNIAQAGDTIIVQPGIYRERVTPVRSGSSASLPITFKSAIPQAAIIRGSVKWSPTTIIKNIYSGELDLSVFKDNSAMDGGNPFLIPCTVTPYGRNGRPEYNDGNRSADANLIYSLGQVFVDDMQLLQCPNKNEMIATSQSWWYDMSMNQLYTHIDVPFKQIEITNQRRVFAPHIRGLRYIVVDGFVIERCGNQYPNKFWTQAQNQQAGMIGTRSGRFWTIQNNTIRFAAGVGIDWGNEGGANQDLEIGQNGQATGSYGHLIKNNLICDNGAAGTASYMGKNFVFSNNIVERNNNWLYYGKQRWESAGVKIHCPTNSKITNNIIRNNYCNGIWSDQGAGQNSIFNANIITGNKGNGINFEIGSGTSGKVLNNILHDNEYNICFATSGGVLIAHNLFLSSQKGDIHTYTFNRPDKWDSLNIEIYYNIFLNSPTYLSLTGTESIASRFMNYNQYSLDGKFSYSVDKKKWISKTLTEWQNVWNQSNADESSIIINTTGSLDISNTLILSTMQKMPFISRPDITVDYFGNMWTETNCVAGPFCSGTYGSPTTTSLISLINS